MIFMDLNVGAVFLAAVATMVLGFLWYSPLLFARPWMKLMGYAPDDKTKLDEMRKEAAKLYGISFVTSLISAIVLARILRLTISHTVLHGIRTGIGVWLGFVTTVQLTDKLFSNRPLQLYLINSGYQLLCYIAMGAILAAWPGN